MIKILVSLCVLVSFSNLQAKVSVTELADKVIYDIEVDGVGASRVKLADADYLKLKFFGVKGFEGIHYKLGHPEIPVLRFYVDADSEGDVQVEQLKRFGLQTKSRNYLSLDLMPSQESRVKIRGHKDSFIKVTDVYKQNIYVPNDALNFYTVKQQASMGGKIRQLVTIYPLQYFPKSKRYELVKNIRVEVTKRTQEESVQLQTKAQQAFAFVIGAQFQGSAALEEYITFKKQLGYKVFKIEIGEQISDATDIRAKLKEIYADAEYDLKHALIIGDVEDVPGFDAPNLTLGVTDHYYRAIDTEEYLSDINGPDIGVGRITVKSNEELKGVVAKFIKYQKGDFEDTSWLNNISFLATDDRYIVAEGTHNYVIENYTTSRGYMGVFPDPNQLGGDQLYAITHKVTDEKVVETMGLGRFVINYSGHGSTDLWAGPTVTQEDVRSIVHGDALPFVVSNACITGQFTMEEAFAETWLKSKTGAIMYWGSMDNTYWDEDDILEKAMYDGIFTSGNLSFNQITQNALSEMWKAYGGENRSKYYWETYVTFGDPSIELRTIVPKMAMIQGPKTLVFGLNTVQYRVTDQDDNALKDIRVGISSVNDEEFVASTYTDENGMVELVVNPKQPGDKYLVTFYGKNILMNTIELLIIVPDAPFLILSDLLVNGDSDLTPFVFEQLQINFDVKNVGRALATDAQFKIIDLKGPARIEENSGELLSVGGEEVVHFDGSGLKLKVLEAASGELISFKLKWQLASGVSGSEQFFLKVKTAELIVSKIDYGDPTSKVGGIRPGQAGDVFLTVKNIGDHPMSSAALSIRAGSCIQVVGPWQAQIDKLGPGASVRLTNPVNLTVMDDCTNTQAANLVLSGKHVGPIDDQTVATNGQFRVGEIGEVLIQKDEIGLTLLDQDTVEYPFEVSGVDYIEELTLSIKITHAYRSDLTVSLVHPDGTEVFLEQRTGGSDDNIEQTYTSSEKLKKLIHKSGNGTWKLVMHDAVFEDVGILDTVHLNLLGFLE
ncbi:MAG: proprotein convertase P-domain-containing protein [Bacteriovoracaceae bacterium]|nr:proprotein convertase P-domain-containing protein [Bacteriovoracaceae bacterium]